MGDLFSYGHKVDFKRIFELLRTIILLLYLSSFQSHAGKEFWFQAERWSQEIGQGTKLQFVTKGGS